MDERMRILSMLGEGKITAEEARLLLDQLEGAREASPAAPTAPRAGKMFRMRVNVVEEGNARPTDVNINLPLKVARIAGQVITRMMPDAARDALEDKGIDLEGLDLVELIDAIADTGGDILNVAHEDEESQVAVRVYVE